MEESAETTVEASKIIRFNGGFERLEAELGDLMCMMEILIQKGFDRYEETIISSLNVIAFDNRTKGRSFY